MPLVRGNLTIRTYYNLLLLGIFAASAVIIIIIVNVSTKELALSDARERARILLDRNLATHTYFSHELKPKVFALTDPYRSREYFDPSWMSSTYAVREIDRRFRMLNGGQYYYKECAVNARSPQNEADPYERAFIERLNSEPSLVEQAGVRTLDGKPFFVVLRRGEVLEDACLRCHSSPSAAPDDLVKQYGPNRSFSRGVGDVVSAISIRVPLEVPYAQANRQTLLLSAVFLGILAMLYVLKMTLSRRMIFGPLEKVRDKAMEIAKDERRLGETIDLSSGPELDDLAAAFNTLSGNLQQSRDHLEETVAQRTSELQKALENVRRLGGLLPICMSCKKIRDDAGYWKQIEVYIRDHSEAEFSHGLCPDCAARLYPDYFKDEDAAAGESDGTQG